MPLQDEPAPASTPSVRIEVLDMTGAQEAAHKSPSADAVADLARDEIKTPYRDGHEEVPAGGQVGSAEDMLRTEAPELGQLDSGDRPAETALAGTQHGAPEGPTDHVSIRKYGGANPTLETGGPGGTYTDLEGMEEAELEVSAALSHLAEPEPEPATADPDQLERPTGDEASLGEARLGDAPIPTASPSAEEIVDQEPGDFQASEIPNFACAEGGAIGDAAPREAAFVEDEPATGDPADTYAALEPPDAPFDTDGSADEAEDATHAHGMQLKPGVSEPHTHLRTEIVIAELPEQPSAAAEAEPIETDPPAEIVPPALRKPGEYRPRLNRARARRARASATSGGAAIQNLEAALQILIGPGDWGVDLSALLRVPDGAQDEVAIELDGEEFWLGQLDEQLLEPLALPDAAAAFGGPLLVTAANLPVTWARTSRDLHVLNPDPRVAGFVSGPRVAIGQESVVICREDLGQAALAQILATGSPEPVRIEGPNVPHGWICWRSVRPMRPSLPAGGPGILDALDPLPAVSIEFSGGIKLSHAAWLEGFPPTIRLLGLLSEGDPVLFDGEEGEQDEEGVWTADRWDASGQHRVEHGGVMASYAIEAGATDWEWWPAWSDAVPLAGALSGPEGARLFQSGPSGTLIGARPGEICAFTALEGGVAMASPRFEPVWLLSGGAGIRRGGPAMIGSGVSPRAPVGSRDAVSRWARAICSSRRAGADGDPERALWNRYLATARSLRKRRR